MVIFNRKQHSALKHEGRSSSFSILSDDDETSSNSKCSSLDAAGSQHSTGSTSSGGRRLKFFLSRKRGHNKEQSSSRSLLSHESASVGPASTATTSSPTTTPDKKRVTFGPRSYAPVSYMDVHPEDSDADETDSSTSSSSSSVKRAMYWSGADLKHMKSREQRLARQATMFHDKNLANYLKLAYGITDDYTIEGMTPESALEYVYQYDANNNKRINPDSSDDDEDENDSQSSSSRSSITDNVSDDEPISLRGLERHVSSQITEHRRDVIQLVLGLQRDIQQMAQQLSKADAAKVLRRGASKCSLASRKFALRLGHADAAVAQEILLVG